jgi:hypothetical protein
MTPSPLGPQVVPDLDVQLPLGMLLWVLAKLDHEDVALALEAPSDGGWSAVRVTGEALESDVARASEAWIVQRPGCAGLVTRVVLRDAEGAPLAAIVAARAPGTPEPVAWRVLLLLALFGSAELDEDALRAAK